MSFMNQVLSMESMDFDAAFTLVSEQDVAASLARDSRSHQDLLHLLSPAAEPFLEEMAQQAQRLTRQHFGLNIGLYAPLYISDFCTNSCTYCGFNCTSDFVRSTLTLSEIEAEAKAIRAMGIRHILVLTGEAPARTPLRYLVDAVRLLKGYFSSIALEIFPLEEPQYRSLIEAGADSLTIYQETYNRTIYKEVHPRGKKRKFQYRLDTPERGCQAGFRGVNIGALFGLGPCRQEALMAALHAWYLERCYPDVEISLSLPRMTSAGGAISPRSVLSDRQFVQFMLAWRLVMPRLGITISTRESPEFRDNLVQLGATRLSAGSRTDVGGYSRIQPETREQFTVTDTRSVEQVAAMIRDNGYQPVYKDWERPW